MRTTITRRLEIDAGHRLLAHGGKCNAYHGHRYAFEVTVTAPTLEDGMIVDMGVIKEKVGGWLDENWDHRMIIQDTDPMLTMISNLGITRMQVYVLDRAPTAENLARALYAKATQLLPHPLSVVSVRCWETPNCWADYVPHAY